MTIVLEIYIIVCILLLLFDIAFLVLKNSKNKHLHAEDGAFKKLLQQEIELYRQNGAFSEKFVNDLPGKLSRTTHMLSLQAVLEEDPDARSWFREFLFAQIGNYQKKPEYVQAFYTYLISTLDYRKEKVPAAFSSEFMHFLESKSLYTFTNTMDAFYAFGETHLLLQALEVVDRRSGFYHHKLLVDGLLSFQGDHEELEEALLARFSQYGDDVKECLLDYFRMQGCEVSDLCLKLMREEKADAEVQYRAMRYFQKFPCGEAKEWFLQILQRENVIWIKQMLEIQGLQNYDDAEVRAAVKKKITSRDWHVRNNAVAFLHRKGLERAELQELLHLQDRYANESLLYQYKEDAETSAFIMDTIRLLEQEKTAAGQPV
ncbi:MAG: hypothetical protein IKB91_06980 [Anaerotignum sp.]|nr:hypothetical protein [Anaerotignum sp.]